MCKMWNNFGQNLAEKDRRFLYNMFAVQNACFRLCIILQKQIKSVKFPVLLQEIAGFQLHSVRVLVFVLAPALGLGFGLDFGLVLVLVFACIGLKEFRKRKRKVLPRAGKLSETVDYFFLPRSS